MRCRAGIEENISKVIFFDGSGSTVVFRISSGSFVVQFVCFVFVVAIGKREWQILRQFVIMPGGWSRVVYSSRGFNQEFQIDWEFSAGIRISPLDHLLESEA